MHQLRNFGSGTHQVILSNSLFLDQNFDELFREEQRLSKLFLVFTGLAILIACPGLFALASFTAEQRTKEIGIRKAMGASVTSITALLLREFTLLVVVSIVLAVVPAYLMVKYWLDQFAYRIEVGATVFVLSGLAALVIAWLTSFVSVAESCDGEAGELVAL